MRSPLWRRAAPPAVIFVVALFSLEVGVRVLHVPAYLVPPPSDVLRTLGAERDGPDLWNGLLQTTGGSLLGFGLSAVGGLLVAVVLSSAGWVQRAFYPYAVFFQTVPIIAIA